MLDYSQGLALAGETAGSRSGSILEQARMTTQAGSTGWPAGYG
jgi:hypothetical protein